MWYCLSGEKAGIGLSQTLAIGEAIDGPIDGPIGEAMARPTARLHRIA